MQGTYFEQLTRLRTLHLHVVLPRLDSEADEQDPEAFEAWVDTDIAEVDMCVLAAPATAHTVAQARVSSRHSMPCSAPSHIAGVLLLGPCLSTWACGVAGVACQPP